MEVNRVRNRRSITEQRSTHYGDTLADIETAHDDG
jgi:hypothetical protein